MAGSIHIHKSESSIIDTVFVCRTTGRVLARHLGTDPLRSPGWWRGSGAPCAGCVRPTRGDARCITYGHLARLAVWRLREAWDADASWGAKLGRAGAAMARARLLGGIGKRLEAEGPLASRRAGTIREEGSEYGVREVEIAF